MREVHAKVEANYVPSRWVTTPFLWPPGGCRPCLRVDQVGQIIAIVTEAFFHQLVTSRPQQVVLVLPPKPSLHLVPLLKLSLPGAQYKVVVAMRVLCVLLVQRRDQDVCVQDVSADCVQPWPDHILLWDCVQLSDPTRLLNLRQILVLLTFPCSLLLTLLIVLIFHRPLLLLPSSSFFRVPLHSR